MIIILCGKSGSGKDAIAKNIVNRYNVKNLISTTSRPIRDGETNGVEYNFISRDEFIEMINRDEFVEYRTYSTLVGGVPETWYYGMPKQDIDKDELYITILDVDGAKSFKNYYGEENLMTVYIKASDDVRKYRAIARGSFDETEWNRRVADDEIKFIDATLIANMEVENEYNDLEYLDDIAENIYNVAKRKTNKKPTTSNNRNINACHYSSFADYVNSLPENTLFRYWIIKKKFTPYEMKNADYMQSIYTNDECLLGCVREVIELGNGDVLIGFDYEGENECRYFYRLSEIELALYDKDQEDD